MKEAISYRDLKYNEVIEASDEMRRADWDEGAMAHEWFKVKEYDVGEKAEYFRGSHFLLRRPI
jgi:hypothetical protein